MRLKAPLLILVFFFSGVCFGNDFGNPTIEKGWNELVKDHEKEALGYFWQANRVAIAQNNIGDIAESYFYLGICSYGSSLENGLQFATKALSEYKKLEKSDLHRATIGRSKCLQLISTIYSRQKKYTAALKLSKEVVHHLQSTNYDNATLGLAYRSIGELYELQNKKDSSKVFYHLAFEVFEKSKSIAYLPGIYSKLGMLSMDEKSKAVSLNYFKKALLLSEQTQNKQAEVISLIGLGKWHLELENKVSEAENLFEKACNISEQLSDKTFEIKAIEALIGVRKKQNNFVEVSRLQQKIIAIKDSVSSSEKELMTKKLEVQFEVSEINRKFELIAKQKEVSRLTNYLLATVIFLFIIVFLFFRRIYKRDKVLLATKEELVLALEDQKSLKELQFTNDLEYKEGQLSAVAFQMLQKNELLEEIRNVLQQKEAQWEDRLTKIVNTNLSSDTNWKDFDKYFESVNKNFYTKVKSNYPEISQNDLKLCALIKLNLSIKEMASILNISPDSVKTARYRLRKKLGLNTEDNLTDFILSI
ncbi:transcriptional regulator [Flavobacterium silvaticum]|uniref:HTH luxR-type domain-containing protein n=1 Tax=Flavobacterium silvaticum TaxID=1852020 RepID=A0A972JIE8_9FLAO|nr:hypothetical protein [Flavobacterium silvaticum]NMH28153.1 hypothetical protein [Flavobacterium silvaticum]